MRCLQITERILRGLPSATHEALGRRALHRSLSLWSRACFQHLPASAGDSDWIATGDGRGANVRFAPSETSVALAGALVGHIWVT